MVSRDVLTSTPSIGTPLWIGGNCSEPPTMNLAGCTWGYDRFTVTQTGLAVGYGSATYEGFPAELQGGTVSQIGDITPASASSVVTSLDLEAPSGLYGVSWIQDLNQTGFSMNVISSAPADLAAAITTEGQSSRVVTAISYDSGHVTFLSYDWQGDTTSVYETQVSTASTSGAPAAAAELAQQGYIITALGRADDSGDIYLVGTRVAGDTVARPFIAASFYGVPVEQPPQEGYAVVGVVSGAANGYLFER